MTNNSLRIGGAMVFWNLSEWTDRMKLKNGFTDLGLERFVPEPRTATAALRDALGVVWPSTRTLIRPLQTKDGFAVVEEHRGVDENVYVHTATVKIDKDLQISMQPYSGSRAEQLATQFNRYLGLLQGTQVTASLVSILDRRLGGTRLRPQGGIYWLPEDRVSEWQKVVQTVEDAAYGRGHSLYLLRHTMDADAVRAIRDAILTEVSGEAKRIHDEVMNEDLGDRALKNRQKEAGLLEAKITLYEEILGQSLHSLHEAVEQARQAAAAAVLLGSTIPQEVS